MGSAAWVSCWGQIGDKHKADDDSNYVTSTAPVAPREWRRDPNSARPKWRWSPPEEDSSGLEGAQNEVGEGVLAKAGKQ